MAAARRGPLRWRLRKRLWNRVARVKFRGNKPATIPVPVQQRRAIKAVPLVTVYPGIPISNVQVADHVPEDEASRLRKSFVGVQVGLGSLVSPMQAGLPPVSDDPAEALAEAYPRAHRRLFPAPERPAELDGPDPPELGALAVAGPLACYVERAEDGGFEWDLRELGGFEHHAGLVPLGVRVRFALEGPARSLRATEVESALGVHGPEDGEWPAAKRVALCAASTHLSLVRHLNWVHLASGGPLAIATRNRLPSGHPLCRLLWPHVYGTQYSNDIVTEPQLGPRGDFTEVFSLTHTGLCELFARSYADYRISVIDPRRDAERRGIANAGFDTPSQDNLQALFDAFHRHAERYLDAYYPSDEDLQKDAHVRGWLDELDRLIPNGIGELSGPGGAATRASVARLVAGFIYLVTVQHEVLGTGMWSYQLWTDKIPVRVYRDGRREPLDVYQRLVNANFNLNVHRARLMQDFSHLAVDARGAELFARLQAELEGLEAHLRAAPPRVWRILPGSLEANMNA